MLPNFFYMLIEIQFVGIKLFVVFPYNAFNFYRDGFDVSFSFMILVVCILSIFIFFLVSVAKSLIFFLIFLFIFSKDQLGFIGFSLFFCFIS